ncbi:MAG: hypothetical protein WKF75_13955 [Singulisphaera sp.]
MLGADGQVTVLGDRADSGAGPGRRPHRGGARLRRRAPAPLALSADGTAVARVEADGVTLRLFDAQDGRERPAIEGPATIDWIAFSPEGRLLASVGPIAWRVYEVATGRSWARFAARPGPYRCLALTPDGQTVLLGNHHRRWAASPPTTSRPGPPPLTEQNATVLAVTCSLDGRRIAAGNGFGRGDRLGRGHAAAARPAAPGPHRWRRAPGLLRRWPSAGLRGRKRPADRLGRRRPTPPGLD